MRRYFYSLLLALFLAFNCSSGIVYAESVIESNQYYKLIDEKPSFTKSDFSDESYEKYSELDKLGRCGTAIACIGEDIMPDEERGAIGMIKPSGWNTIKFDFVNGKYLYNRCHLIGYQLTGENANEKNLITGTRSLNIQGMLPFENQVADYIHETNNHVLYKVTPVFKGDELVARYVKMEAMSVEDKGEGISFVVYCYNKEPGVIINYKDGSAVESSNKSKLSKKSKNEFNQPEAQAYYVINTSTMKFHKIDCRYVDLKSSNQKKVHKSHKQLEKSGYSACKVCNP